MSIWLERFALAVLATIFGAAVLTNPWQLDRVQRAALVVAIVGLSVFAARTIERSRAAASDASHGLPIASSDSTPPDGRGGLGGGGNAVGKDSIVLGGTGGKGGSPGGGRGGDGGGGDAVGEGAMVIGGDGGGGGRSDGRGGAGAESPLKKLSPEALKSWGLTGKEGYGQGGRGANSPEYDRRLRVLSLLSADYTSKYPKSQMVPMPGVLMPPVDWVNGRLTQMREVFRVEFTDNQTDFVLHHVSRD